MMIRTQREKVYVFAFLIIANMVFLPSVVTATEYFVSTTGNDGNPGTQSSPFRTIEQGLTVLKPGDRLSLRSGSYSEKLVSSRGVQFPAGTSWDNPVTIAAFENESVILKGTIGPTAPHIQYLIFDRIFIDASNQESGISINSGAHHLRFINGEVKNAFGTSGINTSYHNDANPGDTFHEFINMNVHHNGLDSSKYPEGRTSDHYHGFYIKTSGNLIENCQIHDHPAWGIHQYVNTTDPRPQNNIFRNNLIWNNGNGGIMINRSDDNLIYNNVVMNNGAGINIGFGNPRGAKVYNNTVYGNQKNGIDIQSGATDSLIINNISYKNGYNLMNKGTNTTISNNLKTNPLFRNEATADFHLQAGSTNAIDKGIPLEEVKKDKDGITRSLLAMEIGAYEYQNDTVAAQDTEPPLPPKDVLIVTGP